MNDLLGSLSNVSELDLELLTLLFARVSASLILLPAFGEKAVPSRVKLVLALAFTALIFPVITFPERSGESELKIPAMILAETTNGILIGFIFRCLVFMLQISGTIAAQSVSLSQSFGAGLGVDPQPAFSTLLVVSCLALLAHLDWHIHIARFYLNSFTILPIGHWPLASSTAEWGVAQIGWTFSLGFSLATPFVVASLIYNLGLGFINKAMPQLMVALVGAPAASFLGLVVLLLTSPFILSYWSNSLVPVTLGLTGFSP